MSTKPPVRLLILEESENSAEELIVLLRTAGLATRAHQIESERDLTARLKEQNWDLLLGINEANGLTMQRVIEIVRDLEKDVPIILIADDRDPASITSGLRIGALDVALDDDDERFTLIINRELNNLENRRLRKRAEVEVQEFERRNQLLLASSASAIAYIHEGMHIYTNNAYAQLFNYDDPDDFTGIPIIDLIAVEDQKKFKSFLKTYDGNESEPEEFTCISTDDSRILTNLSLSHATYDGEACTMVIFQTMTDDLALEDRIKEISTQDLLTGLYNRGYFIEQLEVAVGQAREAIRSYVLFYIGIDDFSGLKTQAGISNADLVLGDLAGLIRQQFDDSQLMARFADDVFTLLHQDIDRDAATKMAEDLRLKIDQHMSEVSGKSYNVTISVGMALISENSPSADEIISRAREAMMSVKPGNGTSFFAPAQVSVGDDGKSIGPDAIMELVRGAIANNSFKLLFQPIISLHGDDDEQFEVLLRLLDADENELLPGEFLGPAEQAGLLEKLDRWVILQSIKLLSVHRANGSKARLFINLTYKSVADDTFLPWMSVALKAARLPSDAIIFQIHENDATSYIKTVAKFSKGMAQLHCKTSINHFGCSLNPFNLLKHLTPDYVKLDGSFAQEIVGDQEKQKELVAMAKSLQATGVLTAISGVEDPMVLSTLWASGINFIQGFYISPPLENMDYDFTSEDL